MRISFHICIIIQSDVKLFGPKMKTLNFILISFLILQRFFHFDVLCLSIEYVECVSPYSVYWSSAVIDGKITLKCSNDSQEIDFINTGLSLVCSDMFHKGGRVEKNRVREVKIENCQMPNLAIKYDIFKVYKQLQVLNISYVGLEVLEAKFFESAATLEKLDASHNKIREISALFLPNTTNLKEINFSYNRIIVVEPNTFSALNKLTTLNLAHNPIASIKEEIFENYYGLADLDLSCDRTFDSNNSRVIILSQDAFVNLTHLINLNLANNPIGNLKIGTFSKQNDLQHLN